MISFVVTSFIRNLRLRFSSLTWTSAMPLRMSSRPQLRVGALTRKGISKPQAGVFFKCLSQLARCYASIRSLCVKIEEEFATLRQDLGGISWAYLTNLIK